VSLGAPRRCGDKAEAKRLVGEGSSARGDPTGAMVAKGDTSRTSSMGLRLPPDIHGTRAGSPGESKRHATPRPGEGTCRRPGQMSFKGVHSGEGGEERARPTHGCAPTSPARLRSPLMGCVAGGDCGVPRSPSHALPLDEPSGWTMACGASCETADSKFFQTPCHLRYASASGCGLSAEGAFPRWPLSATARAALAMRPISWKGSVDLPRPAAIAAAAAVVA